MKIKKNINKYKNLYVKFFTVLFLLILYFVIYKIYIPRVNAFGCFDDCNNFMGGYFLLHGKKLFSQIFFNHNPFMAYISLLIQYFTNPQNLYELILRHRQFLLVFGFIFNLILVFRFGVPVLGFTLFYELTKFYLFGDRFLAEGFIVYPLVYLVGLAFFKFNKIIIKKWEYIFSAILAWFIIFTREPYVPIALILFFYVIWDRKVRKNILNPLLIFSLLSFFTIIYHNIGEFYFNVVTVNITTNFLTEAKSTGLLSFDLIKLFLYPINIFFGGTWNFFRYILVSLDALFVLSSVVLIYKGKWKLILFLYIILGFLNLRYVNPGTTYYAAFHMLCWYGAFLFLSFMMLSLVFKINKKVSYLLILLYAGIFVYNIMSPSSFINFKANSYEEFITNYGVQLQVGTVVNKLSKPTDTLFLDGFDDIIYWQAQRLSPYKYSWYTSLMPYFKKYTDARITMFKSQPPDFYYGSCPKEKDANRLLPKFIKDDYIRLLDDSKPSCLFINKEKLLTISKNQWKMAAESLYTLPKSANPTTTTSN